VPSAPNCARPTILLVDDDDAVRRVTARYLALLGYTVVEAADATRALAAAEGRVDVVLSDIGLPGMPGPALLEALRSRRPTLRAVLMTGFSMEALHPEAWPPGTRLLSKPFTIDELRACLESGGAGSHCARSES
jgi:CheY-like chemotaxis protein